jgi:hypothetical protein
MSTVTIQRYPQIRLADPASAPPARTVAHDGWLARVLGQPLDLEGLTRATAGEWRAGWLIAHESALSSGLVLEIWQGQT